MTVQGTVADKQTMQILQRLRETFCAKPRPDLDSVGWNTLKNTPVKLFPQCFWYAKFWRVLNDFCTLFLGVDDDKYLLITTTPIILHISQQMTIAATCLDTTSIPWITIPSANGWQCQLLIDCILCTSTSISLESAPEASTITTTSTVLYTPVSAWKWQQSVPRDGGK